MHTCWQTNDTPNNCPRTSASRQSGAHRQLLASCNVAARDEVYGRGAAQPLHVDIRAAGVVEQAAKRARGRARSAAREHIKVAARERERQRDGAAEEVDLQARLRAPAAPSVTAVSHVCGSAWRRPPLSRRCCNERVPIRTVCLRMAWGRACMARYHGHVAVAAAAGAAASAAATRPCDACRSRVSGESSSGKLAWHRA
jgi:hypothetical protein